MCGIQRLALGIAWVVVLGTVVWAAPPATQPASAIPLIYCTDLFHPHDDPDDHFDLATVFALPELAVKAVLLEQGKKQQDKPGRIPLEQMFKLTGRHAPYGIGLSEPLKSADDLGLDQPREHQSGVELLLKTLRDSPVPMVVFTAGSVRDLCAAFNREPSLLRQKIAKLYINMGSLEQGELEWNVQLDVKAYIGVMRSGLPIYWCPCAPFGQNRSTHWVFKQGDLFHELPSGLLNYFVYALQRVRPAEIEPQRAMSMDLRPWREILMDQPRNMWCTGPLLHAAGRKICRQGQSWNTIPPAEDHAQTVEVFTFVPVHVEIDERGQTQWREASTDANMHLYRVTAPELHNPAMTGCLGSLYRNLPSSRPADE